MKYLILLFVCCSFKLSTIGQVLKTKSLELSGNVRHELHGHHITQYGTLPYLTELKLAGTSLGVDLGLKLTFNKSWYIIPSVGYYKLTIDDIVNNGIPALPWGTTHYRSIEYRPDSTPLGYSTQKYHYNNLCLGISLGKEFKINRKFSLTSDIGYNYLLTYSQKYHIGEVIYSTKRNIDFGHLVTGRLGINRTFKSFYIGTSFILPIYKQFRKDEILLDNPNENIKKWFGGYGLALRLGKYL